MSNLKELTAALDEAQSKLAALAAPLAEWRAEAHALGVEIAALESDRLDSVAAGDDKAAKKLAAQLDEKRARLADLAALIPRRLAEIVAGVERTTDGPRQAALDAEAAELQAEALARRNRAGDLQREAAAATQRYVAARAKADAASLRAGQAQWANARGAHIRGVVNELVGFEYMTEPANASPVAAQAAEVEARLGAGFHQIAGVHTKAAAAFDRNHQQAMAAGAALREQAGMMQFADGLEPEEPSWTEEGFGPG